MASPRLLVYIPAHTDFAQASEQSRLLKSHSFGSEIEIKTIISVNAVELSQKEYTQLKDCCDELIYHRENLGGDTNINLGYLKALSEQSDFYWILSANDKLMSQGISILIRNLINLETDLLVITSRNLVTTGNLTSAFSGTGVILPIGLISAVIYRTEKFKKAFAAALKFSWTGWGQLSVIQNSIFEFGSISYRTVDEANIYNRNSNLSIPNQIEKNKSLYRHSFFGYPLLVSLLFEHDKKMRKKIIRSWLRVNWYKIRFFKDGSSPSNINSPTSNDVFWTEQLSRNSILSSGILSPILYFFGNLRLIYKLRRLVLARRIKQIVFQRVNNPSK